jgi:hypothetical protein
VDDLPHVELLGLEDEKKSKKSLKTKCFVLVEFQLDPKSRERMKLARKQMLVGKWKGAQAWKRERSKKKKNKKKRRERGARRSRAKKLVIRDTIVFFERKN